MGSNVVLDPIDFNWMGKNRWNILQYIFFCVFSTEAGI